MSISPILTVKVGQKRRIPHKVPTRDLAKGARLRSSAYMVLGERLTKTFTRRRFLGQSIVSQRSTCIVRLLIEKVGRGHA